MGDENRYTYAVSVFVTSIEEVECGTTRITASNGGRGGPPSAQFDVPTPWGQRFFVGMRLNMALEGEVHAE